MNCRAARRQLCDFALEDLARGRIFVAKIDIDVGRFDHMRADQHALKKTMRISFEIVAILERAGLALVAIDCHQPRTWLAQHRAPFTPRWKASTAETAQTRVVERFQQIFLRKSAGAQARQQLIPTTGNVSVEVDVIGQMGVGVAGFRRSENVVDVGMIHKIVTDFGSRRGIAPANARRSHDADSWARATL